MACCLCNSWICSCFHRRYNWSIRFCRAGERDTPFRLSSPSVLLSVSNMFWRDAIRSWRFCNTTDINLVNFPDTKHVTWLVTNQRRFESFSQRRIDKIESVQAFKQEITEQCTKILIVGCIITPWLSHNATLQWRQPCCVTPKLRLPRGLQRGIETTTDKRSQCTKRTTAVVTLRSSICSDKESMTRSCTGVQFALTCSASVSRASISSIWPWKSCNFCS